ncbi:MAG: hypothetical protein NUV77_17270 [Thermoguttaceae bacterium]|jgi:hypothetical protein|nr:hypothetical protein [Thermoguttaceae bacterium]
MTDTPWGLLLATLAGLGTGSCLWPIKIIRTYRFEHYWFVGMLPLVIVPWVIVLTTVADPWSAYAEVGWRPLCISNVFAVGWGIANILAGICAVRIGFALGGAILTGFGVTVAVTVPMLFKGTGMFAESPDLVSTAGLTVMAGVGVMLVGIVLTALAGFGREHAIRRSGQTDRPASGGFLGGLVMAAIAGVLSAGPSLAFVYGHGPIVEAMKRHGAGEVSSGFAVWAAGLFGGALVNILYPAWLMTRNRSWRVLADSLPEFLLASLIGTQLILSFGLQGLGMVMLGTLGASVGTGIQQSMQIVGAQGVGFISGEWRGIGGRPRRQMLAAVCLLLVAVTVMVYAKTLAPR